jgi:hypothetical protein
MNFRLLPILTALFVAFMLSAPTLAAPAAQVGIGETGDDELSLDEVSVEEVVVEASSTFTLTLRIDEVTTVMIPMQVDWRGQGPSPDATDEISVTVSPRILRTGIFSVTVGTVDTPPGTLAVTLATPAPEPETITETQPATSTLPVTTTGGTTAPAVPENAPTTNQIANLRNGPGTDFDVVGTAEVGDVLEVIGQNEDGTWLALAGGQWIAAFLVDNIPADLPVVTPAVAPPPLLPTPTPSAPSLAEPTNTPLTPSLPTATQTPTQAPADNSADNPAGTPPPQEE